MQCTALIYSKKVFEFYANLLDPQEFVRSGPNVTAFNDLNITTQSGSPSSKPFSDFSLTYGFNNFYGRMNVSLKLFEEYTVFLVVKHDTTTDRFHFRLSAIHGDNFYWFDMLKNNNNSTVLRIKASGVGDNDYVDQPNKLYNKQIMLWLVRKNNTSSIAIAGVDHSSPED